MHVEKVFSKRAETRRIEWRFLQRLIQSATETDPIEEHRRAVSGQLSASLPAVEGEDIPVERVPFKHRR